MCFKNLGLSTLIWSKLCSNVDALKVALVIEPLMVFKVEMHEKKPGKIYALPQNLLLLHKKCLLCMLFPWRQAINLTNLALLRKIWLQNVYHRLNSASLSNPLAWVLAGKQSVLEWGTPYVVAVCLYLDMFLTSSQLLFSTGLSLSPSSPFYLLNNIYTFTVRSLCESPVASFVSVTWVPLNRL
jgi:hypothetical protein